MTVSVLVLGADSLARGGLAAVIAAQPGLRVAGEATGPDMTEDIASDLADVGVWDLGAGHAIAALELEYPVLALASDSGRALEAVEAGASGVLFRDGDGPRLAAAINALNQGLLVVDESFRDALWRARSEPSESSRVGEELTGREREVLGLLAQGLSNRAIGRRLQISENTARFHVAAILAKLGARSRTDAVVRAARAGLVMF